MAGNEPPSEERSAQQWNDTHRAGRKAWAERKPQVFLPPLSKTLRRGPAQ